MKKEHLIKPVTENVKCYQTVPCESFLGLFVYLNRKIVHNTQGFSPQESDYTKEHCNLGQLKGPSSDVFLTWFSLEKKMLMDFVNDH